MAINRLVNHTGKKKHTTKARLADFYVHFFYILRLQKQSVSSHANPHVSERYATVPMYFSSLWDLCARYF